MQNEYNLSAAQIEQKRSKARLRELQKHVDLNQSTAAVQNNINNTATNKRSLSTTRMLSGGEEAMVRASGGSNGGSNISMVKQTKRLESS